MYIARDGIQDYSPTNPTERAEYYLEQIRVYLLLHQHHKNNEYAQVQIIFNSFLNIMTEDNYQILVKIMNETSAKLSTMSSYSMTYWNEFLKYTHWKMTNHAF